MRVLVATTAGVGHFAPLVPFAAAVRAAGHAVRVAAPASFARVVEQAGFEPIPLADPAPADVRTAFERAHALPMEQANQVVLQDVFAGADARAALPDLQAAAAAWRPDVMLRETMEFASALVAEALNIPQIQVAMTLASVEAAWLPLVDAPLRALGSARGLAGLLAAPRWTLVPASLDEDEPAGGRPTHRFRYPARSPASSALPAAWWPEPALPLVYVTFGSVAAEAGFFPGFYRAVIDALADLPVRVLLTLGEAGDPSQLGTLPSQVHVERWWPQEQVLPHSVAVVGHGGFTTTLAGLAAGVPMVLVPLFSADQYALAHRVQVVGAGVAVEDRGSAPRLLRAALERVLAEPSYAQTARRLADEMARLPGPPQGLSLLEAMVQPEAR